MRQKSKTNRSRADKIERRKEKRELKRNPSNDSSFEPIPSNYIPKKEIKPLRALTETQGQYIASIITNTITFSTGPAGTGKSYVAGAFAAEQLKLGIIDKIIITRPGVESGRNWGALPGPQPLDAKILTPDGWTTMGELKVDDYVIGKNGKKIKVLGIYPKGQKLVYKITTSDGTSTEACGDHLWFTRTSNDQKKGKQGSVKSTEEILNSITTIGGKINHLLPRNDAVEFNPQELPITPYVLGAILGDGYIGYYVAITGTDNEVIDRINEEVLDIGCRVTTPKSGIVYNIRSDLKFNKPAKSLVMKNTSTGEIINSFESIGIAAETLNISKSTLQSRCDRSSIVNDISFEFEESNDRWTNPLKNKLYELGLSDKTAYDKFIPEIYKFSSIDDRLNLIRGLMDTDGTVKNNGEASFATVSKRLAEDLIDVVRSLGGRAILRERNRSNEKTSNINGREIKSTVPSYEFTISLPNDFNPFYISRKASKWSQKHIQGSFITSIEPLCEKEVQCILVDSEDHLYITDEFIVTHNTLEEKYAPFLEPFNDVLEERLGKSFFEYLKKAGKIVASPLEFMRGKTFTNSIIILDEAQNVDNNQMLMFLTRIGENSKMIIDGSLTQCDIRNSGLANALQKLKDVPSIGMVEFDNDDIVRHGIIRDILIAYNQ